MTSKDQPEEILDDLESIRDLLDEEAADLDRAAQDETRRANTRVEVVDAVEVDLVDDDVPILEDVVSGAIVLDESPLTRTASISFPGEIAGEMTGEFAFDEGMMKSLLGDEWKDVADDILTQTRDAIQESKDQWSPQDTDELNEALKVRIDRTIDTWLAEVLAEKIGDLRERLKSALQEESRAQLEDQLGDSDDQSLRT